MKVFMKKHKILVSIISILLLLILAVGGFVVSKLNKLDYHDGAAASEVVEEMPEEIPEKTVEEEQGPEEEEAL